MPNRRRPTEEALDAEMRALMAEEERKALRAEGLALSDPDGTGPHAEDEPDLDGYAEEQRAEMAEILQAGPSDGVVITDLYPDRGWHQDREEDGRNGFSPICDDR